MTLYMLHAPLDLRIFNAWAGARGVMQRGGFDEGAALHRLLAALFGKGTVQPFRLFTPARGLKASLYAYSIRDHHALAEEAAGVGTPDDLQVLPPDTLRSKAMPEGFETGRRLGFDLCVRPVRRARRELIDPQATRSPRIKAGAELVAFRLEALTRFPPATAILKSRWLPQDARGRRFTRRGSQSGWAPRRASRRCAWPHFSAAESYEMEYGPEGPDAIMQGTLLVDAPDRLMALLKTGVGRHRAYGYGMLILRPPDYQSMNR